MKSSITLKKNFFKIFFSLFFALLAFYFNSSAATLHRSSTTASSAWTAGTAWSTSACGTAGTSVPTLSDDVLIDCSGKTTTGNSTMSCNNLTISSGTLSLTTGTLTVYGNLVISGGTLTISSTAVLNISGNFTYSSGTFTYTSGTGEVSFMGGSTQTITNTPALSLYNVKFTGSGGKVLAGVGNFTVANTLTTILAASATINSGSTLTLSGSSSHVISSTSTITINSGGTMNVSGSGNLTAAGATYTVNGLMNFSRAGIQTVPNKITVGSTGELRLSGSGAKTWNSGTTITINGKCSWQGTATVAASGVSPTFNAGSTLEFAGTAAMTLSSYYISLTMQDSHLILNDANGLTLDAGSRTFVNYTATSGKLTIPAGGTLTIKGTVASMTATNSFKGSATSNLSFTGTGAVGTIYFDQTTDGTTNNIATLTLNRTSSGNVILGNKVVVGTTMTMTNGSFTLNGQFLTLNGTITGCSASNPLIGSATASGGITLANTSGSVGSIYMDQTSAATRTIYNLTVNGLSSGDAGTFTTPVIVSGVLTLTAGRVDMGANTMTITNSANTAVVWTSGWVYGTSATAIMTRAIPASATGTLNWLFPISESSTDSHEIDLIGLTTSASTSNISVTCISSGTGGTAGTDVNDPLTTTGPRYWKLTSDAANITSSKIKLTDAEILGNSVIALSTPNLNGTYNSTGTSLKNVGLNIQSNNITTLNTTNTNYFVVAQAVPINLCGNKTICPSGCDYTSISGAVSDLNAATLTCDVVFELQSTYTSASEVFPIVFTPWGNTGGPWSVTFRPASDVASTLTTSGNPGASTDLMTFNGVDNLIFDGRPGGTGSTSRWTIQNTLTASAGPVITFINDASNNTIEYCDIQSSNTTAASGAIVFGTTIGTTGNDNNIIDNCSIHNNASTNPATGIYSNGTGAYPNATNNNNNTITNNNIYNCTANGIYVTATGNGDSWDIEGNSLYYVGTATAAQTGINFLSGSNSNIISGNYIGGQAALCAGSAWTNNLNSTVTPFSAITVTSGTGTATDIKGNVIQNINLSGLSTSSSVNTSIVTISGGNVNFGGTNAGEGNTIGSATTGNIISALSGNNGAAQYTAGIYASSNNTVNILNNSIQGISATGTGCCPKLRGIFTGTTGTYNISGNLINNLVIPNFTGGSYSGLAAMVIGILSQSTTAGQTISNNTITNLSENPTNANSTIYGIYYTGPTSGTNLISGNTIHTLTTTYSANVSNIYGIYLESGGAYTANLVNNMISIGNGMTGATNFYGIYRNSTGACNFYYNTISINGIQTSGTGQTNYAIYSANTSAAQVFNNNILVNTRGGLATAGALYLNGTTNVSSDYNDFYAINASYTINNSGTTYSLPVWQSSQSKDTHSKNLFPSFTSATDLHLTNNPANYCLWNAGTAIGSYTTDIDDVTRIVSPATNPTIGCHELTTEPSGISGSTFTIGSTAQGDDFNTLTEALSAFACTTLTSAITLDLTSYYNSANEPAFPILVNPISGASATNTITIEPAAGVNAIITSTTSNVIVMNGARYFNFNGTALTGSRTLDIKASASSTYAVGFANGAQYNTFQNCNIQAYTSGYGIQIGTTPNAGVGNSYNTFDNNNIYGYGAYGTWPTAGIVAQGNTNSAAQYNVSNTISNNNIYNFNTGGVYIQTGCGDGWNISDNSFYNSTGATNANQIYFISFNSSNSSNNLTISGNFVGGTAPNCGGGYYISSYSNCCSGSNSVNIFGIYCIQGNAGTGNIISNNTISNISQVGAGNGNGFDGIYYSSTGASATISGNVVGSDVTALSIKDNGTNGNNAAKVGIEVGGSGTVNVNNNIIANIAYTGTSSGTYGRMVGIYHASTAAVAISITGNKIHDLTCPSYSTTSYFPQMTNGSIVGNLGGIVVPVVNPTAITISQNTIYNLYESYNAATAFGIYGILTYGSSGGSHVVERNNIHHLYAHASNTTANIIGIGQYSAAGATVYKNNMIDLGYTPSGSITSANPIYGIMTATSRYAMSLYNNSIYIGGTGVSTTATLTAGIYRSSNPTSGTDNIKNNIVVNNRTNNTTGGNHYCIYLNGTTGLTPNLDYNFYYNNYNGGAGNAYAYVGFITSARRLLSDWQTGTALESHSLYGDPNFVSPTATTPDLHVQLPSAAEGVGVLIAGITDDFDGETRANLTPVDIGADAGNYSDIPSINYTPLTATLSTSSRILSNVLISSVNHNIDINSGTKPRIYFRKSTNTNTIEATNDASTDGWKWVEASEASSPFSFNIDYTLLNGAAPGPGTIIQYFVVAQDDNSPTPGVAINSGTFASNPTSVDLATANLPTGTINQYQIMTGVNATYYVGPSGGCNTPNYSTLTAIGGFFEQVMNKCDGINNIMNQNVIVYITGNISTETGATSLNQWTEDGNGPYTLTIVPCDATLKTISNNSGNLLPLITLNGADRVTFDGSSGGSGRYLLFRDANAAQASWKPAFLFNNGATNDVIKNCQIESNNNADAVYGAAVIVLGGIAATGNAITDITIDNNIIRNRSDLAQTAANRPYTLILSQGPSTSQLNRNITITNNQFSDFYAKGIGVMQNGSNYVNGPNWNISNNTFYHAISGNLDQYPIYFNAGPNSYSNIIQHNTIGGSAADNSGTWTNSYAGEIIGIYAYVGGSTMADSTSIHGNVIKKINMTSTGFSDFIGIESDNGYVSINGNTVGELTDLNSIVCAGNGGSNAWDNSPIFGIWNQSPNETWIKGNTVGILKSSQPYNYTCGIRAGAYEFYTGGPTTPCGKVIINNNIIGNPYCSSALQTYAWPGGLSGIAVYSSATDNQINNNTIYNLQAYYGANRNVICVGIALDGNASDIGGGTCSKNKIYKLSNVNTGDNTGTIAPQMFGIWTGSINGTGNYIVDNNMISLQPVWTNDLMVIGIQDYTTPGNTMQYYHNTVYIGGTNTAAGANPSYCFFRFGGGNPLSNNGGTMKIKNNIFINNRTLGSSSKHRAIGSYCLNANVGWASTDINNNFLSTVTTTTAGRWQATDYNFNGWQTNSTGDANSIYIQALTTGASTATQVNPNNLFIDPTVGNLHINLTETYKFVNELGATGTGITTDIDGDTRCPGGGCPGGASVPDIGADEFVSCTNVGITSATYGTSPICNSATTTLTANGVVGTNAVVTWWSGTGGTGTNYGTGVTLLNAAPGTYYARVTGDCGSPTEASVTVAAKTDVAITDITAGANPICSIATTNLIANGVAGTGAILKWWTGAGGTGTQLGTDNQNPLTGVGTGTYYARVTGDCGTPAETSITITAKTNVAITDITAVANPICSTSTTDLTANGVAGTNSLLRWWTGPGATGIQLGTDNQNPLTSLNPGTYYAMVTGDCGTPAEATITVNAKTDVAITDITAAANPICATTTTNLTANGVTGTNALLQWWTGTGGTGTQLDTDNQNPLTGVGAGTYYAQVTGDCGTAQEATITVTNIYPPSIPTIYGNTTACPSDQLSFDVDAITGGSYQWAVSGNPTNFIYSNSPATNIVSTWGMSGTVYVTVTNSCGYATNSKSVMVTSATAPLATAATGITTTQFNANWNTVTGATKYYLDVATTNTFNTGTFLSGYNDLDVGLVLTKTVTGITAGNTYYYRVRALNCAGLSTNSNTITVSTGCTSVTIINHPVSDTLCTSQKATFSITVSGTAPFTYQWWKVGTPDTYINKATNATYSINSVNIGDAGQYYCVIKNCNNSGNVSSNLATLTVTDGANITYSPVNATAHVGGTVNYNIVNSGSGLTYKWYRASSPAGPWTLINNGGTNPTYSNADQNSMTISNVQLSMNNYNFRCVVSDGCGQSVTSSPATLTISTGIPGLWVGGTPGSLTNWETGGNWDDGNVPNGTTDVIIPGSATYMPIINNAIVAVSHSVTINPRASLYIKGTLNTGGDLVIESNASGTGAIKQDDGATLNIGGNITVKRYMPVAGYHYISSPFATATVNQITNFTPRNIGSGLHYLPEVPWPSGSFPNMWEIDEKHTHDSVISDYNSWMPPAIGEIMSPTKGYCIFLTSPTTISFTKPGLPLDLNGSQAQYDYFVTKESESTDLFHNNKCVDDFGSTTGPNPKSHCLTAGPTNGWHLVGNPYASPVDIDSEFSNYLSQFTPIVAFFKPTNGYNGIYGYYHIYSGSSGAFHPTQYIPAMQSFFVQNSDAMTPPNNPTGAVSSYALSFKNSMRSIAPAALTGNFYKKVNNMEIPLVILSAFESDKPSMRDEAVIYFHNDASNGVNTRFDATKLMNTEPSVPNIYSVMSAKRFAIKALPEVKDNLIIPIGFSITEAGKYSINANAIKNLPADAHVYLVDTKLGISQDLTVNSLYTFSINENDNSRFYLRFTLSNDNSNDAEICNIYSTDNDIYINYNNPLNNTASLSIMNIEGQIVKADIRINNGTYHTALNLATGVYLVKVTSANKVYTQKVFIK